MKNNFFLIASKITVKASKMRFFDPADFRIFIKIAKYVIREPGYNEIFLNQFWIHTLFYNLDQTKHK